MRAALLTRSRNCAIGKRFEWWAILGSNQ